MAAFVRVENESLLSPKAHPPAPQTRQGRGTYTSEGDSCHACIGGELEHDYILYKIEAALPQAARHETWNGETYNISGEPRNHHEAVAIAICGPRDSLSQERAGATGFRYNACGGTACCGI